MTVPFVAFLVITVAIVIECGVVLLSGSGKMLDLPVAGAAGLVVFGFVGYAMAPRDSSITASQEWLYLVTSICVGALYVATLRSYSISPRRYPRGKQPPPDRPLDLRGRKRLVTLVVAGLAIKAAFQNPFFRFDAEQSNYVSLLANIMSVPVALIAGYELIRLSRRSGHYWWKATLAVAVLMLGLISASRTPMTYTILGLGYMFLRGRHEKRRSPSTAGTMLSRVGLLYVVPLVFVSLVIIASFVKLTTGAIVGGDDPSMDIGNAMRFAQNKGYTDVFQNTCFIEETWGSSVTYEPGATLAALAAGPIPRSIWPTKPKGLSWDLTVTMFGETIARRLSLAPGLVGELWMNGGWLALLLGAPLIAYLQLGLARISVFVQRRTQIPIDAAFAAVWVMTLMQFRGDIYTITVRGGEYVAGVLLLGGFIYRRPRKWRLARRKSGSRTAATISRRPLVLSS